MPREKVATWRRNKVSTKAPGLTGKLGHRLSAATRGRLGLQTAIASLCPHVAEIKHAGALTSLLVGAQSRHKSLILTTSSEPGYLPDS